MVEQAVAGEFLFLLKNDMPFFRKACLGEKLTLIVIILSVFIQYTYKGIQYYIINNTCAWTPSSVSIQLRCTYAHVHAHKYTLEQLKYM